MTSCFTRQKGTALFIVLATILVVIVLANAVLNIIASQARLTHHEISRIRAYYAAQAGLVFTLEALRTGFWTPSAANGLPKYACLNDCVDPPSVTGTNILPIPPDATIPYHVQIKINPLGSGPGGTSRLEAKVDYTYTPTP